jgi:hypothetical protein
MIRLVIFALIVLSVVLALTNPSQESHKNAVYAATATRATQSEKLGKIAAEMLGGIDVLPLTYNNHFLYSTTTLNGETASLGLCARVWTFDHGKSAVK